MLTILRIRDLGRAPCRWLVSAPRCLGGGCLSGCRCLGRFDGTIYLGPWFWRPVFSGSPWSLPCRTCRSWTVKLACALSWLALGWGSGKSWGWQSSLCLSMQPFHVAGLGFLGAGKSQGNQARHRASPHLVVPERGSRSCQWHERLGLETGAASLPP